jgi:hypothetical protein
MKKILFLICMATCLTTGCTLFGLDLQTDYDYEHSTYNAEIGTDAWTFMNSRTDIFSSMLDAIAYVKDIEPEIENYYRQKGNTYLLLTNTALTDIQSSIVTSVPSSSPPNTLRYGSYFAVNKINVDGQWVFPSGWNQYPKQQIAEMLKYHIVKEMVGYGYTASTPTWYDTYASADTAKINIYLYDGREAYLYINNYAGNPGVTVAGSTTVAPLLMVVPRTHNLIATNGLIHVVDQWFLPPRRNVIF